MYYRPISTQNKKGEHISIFYKDLKNVHVLHAITVGHSRTCYRYIFNLLRFCYLPFLTHPAFRKGKYTKSRT